MKNLTARRAVAFIIDYFLFCAAFTVAGTMAFILILRIWEGDYKMIFMLGCIPIGVGMVLLWGYFFVLDCNAKFDLGKRITRIAILCHNQEFSRSIAIKHSVLKVLAGMIWPVSFVYYLIRHKMIYDEYLGITIIEA